MTAHDQMRAMLDQLMGTGRNGKFFTSKFTPINMKNVFTFQPKLSGNRMRVSEIDPTWTRIVWQFFLRYCSVIGIKKNGYFISEYSDIFSVNFRIK